MKNFREQDPNKPGSYEPALLEVFVTADTDAQVTMEIPSLSFRHRLVIPAGEMRSVRITPEAELDTFPRPQLRALHIQSSAPIAVYALNRRIQTTDTYLALPTDVLGTDYRVMCYSKLSAVLTPIFAIVATEDDTRVEILPTTPTTDGHGAQQAYSTVLDRGQVYQVRAQYFATGSGDLTGTRIRSSKPIAVFSGHTCAYVPPGVKACNHLVEQLPPVNTWGKHYYIGKLKGRSRYTVRILASQNRTRVFKNQTLIAVLDAGEYYEETNATDHMQITADKPILVAQFSQGYGNGDEIGDPMMILISPTQQFARRYRIITPVQGSWDHYINVVAREEALSGLRLDGRPITREQFERIGITSYAIAQLRLNFGTHTITADEPFGLYSYGFGYRTDAYDAYGTMGGQTFFILDTLRDQQPPQTTFQLVMGGKALHVIARDDRPTDSGLDSIVPLEAVNLRAYLPRLERGQPQTEFNIHPLDPQVDGHITLAFVDAAGNRRIAQYVYCYNPERRRFEFADGERCPEFLPWHLSVYGIVNAVYHTAAFNATGTLTFPRSTGNAYGSALSIGTSIGYAFNERVRFFLRTMVEPFGQSLSAPDSTISLFRMPNDSVIPVQFDNRLTPTAPMLGIGIGSEIVVLSSIKGTQVYELTAIGGVQAALPLSSSVAIERRIVLPQPVPTPPDIARRQTYRLSSLQVAVPELFGGFGLVASLPHLPRWSLVLTAQYVHPLGSMLNDADWYIARLQLALGVRYRF
ncbi:MAG: IgGFc-binding protein [Chlorobi bacterium]|nr:IgGFc-binding protein [Chlorobiota bacterium]